MEKEIMIPRRSLHTQVANALREKIITCALKPGERLNEVQLCEIYGISRTPLREAIKMLETERLVEIRPHRGAIVSEISLHDIEEIFDLLAPLERLGVQLAIARISTGDFAELQMIHDTMIACYNANDREGCFQNDYLFHNRVVDLARHEVLKVTHISLTNRSQRGRYLAPYFSQEKLDEAMEAHNALIRAIESRDSNKAGDIMHEHVWRTSTFVLDSIRKIEV